MQYNFDTREWEDQGGNGVAQGGFSALGGPQAPAAPAPQQVTPQSIVPNTSGAIMGDPKIQGIMQQYGLKGPRAEAMQTYLQNSQSALGQAPDRGFDWQNRIGDALLAAGAAFGGPNLTGLIGKGRAAREKRIQDYDTRKAEYGQQGNELAYKMRMGQIGQQENREMFRSALGGEGGPIQPNNGPITGAGQVAPAQDGGTSYGNGGMSFAQPGGAGLEDVERGAVNPAAPPSTVQGVGAEPSFRGSPGVSYGVEPPPKDPRTPPAKTGDPQIDRLRQMRYAQAYTEAGENPSKAIDIMADFQEKEYELRMKAAELGVKESELSLKIGDRDLNERKFAEEQRTNSPEYLAAAAEARARGAASVAADTVSKENAKTSNVNTAAVGQLYDELINQVKSPGFDTIAGPIRNTQIGRVVTDLITTFTADTAPRERRQQVNSLTDRFIGVLKPLYHDKGPFTDKDADVVRSMVGDVLSAPNKAAALRSIEQGMRQLQSVFAAKTGVDQKIPLTMSLDPNTPAGTRVEEPTPAGAPKPKVLSRGQIRTNRSTGAQQWWDGSRWLPWEPKVPQGM